MAEKEALLFLSIPAVRKNPWSPHSKFVPSPRETYPRNAVGNKFGETSLSGAKGRHTARYSVLDQACAVVGSHPPIGVEDVAQSREPVRERSGVTR